MAWISRFFAWLFKDVEVEAIDPITTPLEAPVRPSEPPIVPKPEEVAPPVITKPTAPIMTNREKLYEAAAKALGKRMILDPAVPQELGCASSLSHVLINAGVSGLPRKGIAGTAQLHDWMLKSGQFEVVSTPLPGDVISSRTGTPGARLSNGHQGIVVKHGICSNNSATGLWSQHWTLPKWIDYYQKYGNIPTVYLRRIG